MRQVTTTAKELGVAKLTCVLVKPAMKTEDEFVVGIEDKLPVGIEPHSFRFSCNLAQSCSRKQISTIKGTSDSCFIQ